MGFSRGRILRCDNGPPEVRGRAGPGGRDLIRVYYLLFYSTIKLYAWALRRLWPRLRGGCGSGAAVCLGGKQHEPGCVTQHSQVNERPPVGTGSDRRRGGANIHLGVLVSVRYEYW